MPDGDRVTEVDTATLPGGERARAAPVSLVPGLAAALVVLAVLGGIALSIDFPRAAYSLHSDEATYYMMGHSLAEDGDLTYRHEDLTRVWREFPSGPLGVFLKRGRTVRVVASRVPPFVRLEGERDPDDTRLYFGKSYAYPLFAAPFVRLLGTNGFLLFHAVLLALVVLAGYMFLNTRLRPGPALILVTGFLGASVAPVYYVWITPELFNFALVFLAYFCWLYKEVAPPASVHAGRWLRVRSTDSAAAALLAVATFSKPSNVLLIVPIVAWQLGRRRWRQALVTGAVFGIIVAAFFAVNIAVTGDWNFQGGERRTFYFVYPFQPGAPGFDAGADRVTERVLSDVIFDRQVFWTVLSHNLAYFIVGRYSGLLPYFFPALFAAVAFLLAPRRERWQVFVLVTAVAEILLLLIWIPYNYFGGGGTVGNRYFMSIYPLFLFLLPPLESSAVALVPWLVGPLFVAQLLINPFRDSFQPNDAAKQGPLRLLPVELSLVNDLPVNTNPSRAHVRFGENERAFQLYFLDDNALPRDGGSFWIRGRSTADLILKTPGPSHRLVVTFDAGPIPNRVRLSVAGQTREAQLAPEATTVLTVPLDQGFPYLGTRVWLVRMSSEAGFIPMFTGGGERFAVPGRPRDTGDRAVTAPTACCLLSAVYCLRPTA